ncbi:TonB-dependent receptor [Lacihabitans sp. LS3-19]|uniref:TonB-dependent receptor plug domain-containing protein n=1 Tax=Lacihabitans sp. LS3-19 TaxID=2487335 RepID=UPI0020CBFC5E|nr:TonB-dependent receptor [Lacihabitans sp. LS3-19]MCP9770019.1 TonB-dependent receptor [Lacihabitans sp. LS3-19]
MKFLFTILFCLVFSFSQAQDSTQIDLSELTVTANINKTELKNVGRNITIIDQKTIKESPVKTLDGILQYALNVDVRSRSSFGVQADISIRGGNFDQTLILVDGVKVNDPQTGHHSLNIPVPFSMIEKIEILQGGASRVFGPSAFAGVVNIITKKVSKNTLSLQAVGGQYNMQNLGINAGGVFNQNSIGLAFDYLKNDGYAPNTSVNKKTFSGSIGHIYNKGSLDFSVGNLSNHFGASNFYHPKFYNQYEEVEAWLNNLTWKHKFSKNLTGVFMANYRQHHDLYDFDNYRNTEKLSSVNFHKTDVIDIEWKFKYFSKFGQSAFGAEYRKESVLSNRLGDNLGENIAIEGHEGVFYTKAKSRDNTSFFLEQLKNIGKLSLAIGTLANYNSSFGLSFYPGMDINYLYSKNISVYGSLNRSLRYPTFTELYLNTATVKADPNLKPEKALNLELGLKYLKERYSATYAVFYRKTSDAIDKVKRPEMPVPTIENINNINMFGLELSQNYAFSKDAKFIEKISFNYAFLKADRKEEGFQSFYTLNYLKHKLSFGVFLEPIKNTQLSIWYTLKSRAGNYQWDNNSPLLAYPEVHLVDLRLNKNFKKIRAFGDVTNLLNKQYFEYGFVALPGRWISVGINADF